MSWRKWLHRSIRKALAVGAMVALLIPMSARADLWGFDMGPLSTIVAQGAVQVTQVAQELHTLAQTYDEAKKVASYADDAVKAFNAAKSLNGQLFGQSLVSGLSMAFPDVQRIETDIAAAASPGGNWAQGSGQLGSLVSRCVGSFAGAGGSGCIQLQNVITASDARRAISAAFGTAPSVGTAAVDGDAAKALAAAQADVNRNKYMRDVTVAQAMNTCSGGGGFSDTDAQACQTAANAAQIEALSQQSYMSDQLATQNRLQAGALSVQNAQAKVQLEEAAERRDLLLQGATGLDPTLTGQLGDASNIGVDMN
jgi:hypothetical protein